MMRLKLILTAAALSVTGHAAIAQELTGTLEKIRSTGVTTIGHRESSIPFSYYDKSEKVVGVNRRRFFARRVVSLTNGDEFHSEKKTEYPSDFSH